LTRGTIFDKLKVLASVRAKSRHAHCSWRNASMVRNRKLPSRLHHTAYTTKDREKTREFYEALIGIPLVATWSESDELFGKVRTYCHCFFGLADGGALASLLPVRR
jgi:hypothetical protein